MKNDRACDLCGLDVGTKPYYLDSAGKRLQFCCDGCRGVYQMLHETDLSPPATAVAPKDAQPSKGEMP